jgi:hypothetical protein
MIAPARDPEVLRDAIELAFDLGEARIAVALVRLQCADLRSMREELRLASLRQRGEQSLGGRPGLADLDAQEVHCDGKSSPISCSQGRIP